MDTLLQARPAHLSRASYRPPLPTPRLLQMLPQLSVYPALHPTLPLTQPSTVHHLPLSATSIALVTISVPLPQLIWKAVLRLVLQPRAVSQFPGFVVAHLAPAIFIRPMGLRTTVMRYGERR